MKKNKTKRKIIGWKVVRDGWIVKLEILGSVVGPFRFSQFKDSNGKQRSTWQYRTSKAKVLGIMAPKKAPTRRLYQFSPPPPPLQVASIWDSSFFYKKGETVRPRWGFDRRPHMAFGGGIHFFKKREYAERYRRIR